MISRQVLELEEARRFVTELFWRLDSWTSSLKTEVDSLRRTGNNTESLQDRRELEIVLRRGFMMRVSQLSTMVGEAYRRLYAYSELVEQEEQVRTHLNDTINQLIDYHTPFFESMGSSIVVSDLPEAIIYTRRETSGPLFSYLTWWILDAWPDGQITVDFAVDEEKAQVIFQDPTQIHTSREYKKDGHESLLVWSCIIEYLTVVEHHGWCVWPQPGEPRELRIILPLCPPTAEELDALPPTWMQ